MISIHDYIVEVKEKEISEYTLESGFKLYKNQAEMFDGFDFKRDGEVLCDCITDKFGIRKGDIAVFHHNIVQEWFNNEGEKEVSKFLVDGEKLWYRIPKDLIYGFWRDGEFHAVGDNIFIEPIEEKKLKSDIIETLSEEAKLKGKLLFIPEWALELGFNVGDEVVFDSEECKYHFPLLGDDREIWRMKINWLMAWISKLE